MPVLQPTLWLVVYAILLLPSRPEPVPPPGPTCSRDLQRFAPDRPTHAVVVAIFTGEDDGGYKPAWIRAMPYSERRRAVRQTWKAQAQALGIPAFFLLSDYRLDPAGRREADTFRDFVLLHDPNGEAWGYQGLSAKTLFLMQFIARQCAAVKYLFKCDDDTYVHVPRLSLFAQATHGRHVSVGKQHCGRMVAQLTGIGAAPEFQNNTGLKEFPCYMQGGGYLLSGDVVKALGALAAVIPLQRYRGLEDMAVGLWMTGWNLTKFDLRAAKMAIDLYEPTSRRVEWLCKDRWLFIHRVSCSAVPSMYDRVCGPKGKRWAVHQRLVAPVLSRVPPALLQSQ
eukprot:EG_transcript_14116